MLKKNDKTIIIYSELTKGIQDQTVKLNNNSSLSIE